MRRLKTLSVNVDVEQDEVLDLISDEDLVAELGLRNAGRTHLETVREVIDLIKADDKEEAILRLEREFWPKWKSVGDSLTALSAALHPRAVNDNKEAALGAVA
jgi:2-keto-3-deoxy-L-rhamnonate aldolase RhmA